MKSRAVPYSVQALYVYEWSFWTSKEMYTTINIKTTSSQSNVVQFSSSEFSSFRAKWLTLRRARRRSPTLSRPHSTTPTSSRGSSPTRPTRAISWSYYCGKLNGKVARHADILATILARMSARMSASASSNAAFTIVCGRRRLCNTPPYSCELPISRTGPIKATITSHRWPLIERCTCRLIY